MRSTLRIGVVLVVVSMTSLSGCVAWESSGPPDERNDRELGYQELRQEMQATHQPSIWILHLEVEAVSNESIVLAYVDPAFRQPVAAVLFSAEAPPEWGFVWPGSRLPNGAANTPVTEDLEANRIGISAVFHIEKTGSYILAIGHLSGDFTARVHLASMAVRHEGFTKSKGDFLVLGDATVGERPGEFAVPSHAGNYIQHAQVDATGAIAAFAGGAIWRGGHFQLTVNGDHTWTWREETTPATDEPHGGTRSLTLPVGDWSFDVDVLRLRGVFYAHVLHVPEATALRFDVVETSSGIAESPEADAGAEELDYWTRSIVTSASPGVAAWIDWEVVIGNRQ